MDAAKAVIGKLLLKKFLPVENAAIQSTYRMIEAHALKRDTLTKVSNIAFRAVSVRCDAGIYIFPPHFRFIFPDGRGGGGVG